MITRSFLLLTLTVWIAAAWYARGYLRPDVRRLEFWGFFALTMLGNVGAVIARDVITFYVFYAVMTFAGFGLIIHDRSEAARRAGRVYIVMAVLGEALLLAGMVLLVGGRTNMALSAVPSAVAESPARNIIVTLLLTGFGIKVGAAPLHVWLPLAHPVAPTPASAALSGAMIKAGLLGWLRFLPLGAASMPMHGAVCVVTGGLAMLLAALAGATQRDAKTALAYSSVSQMGIATLGVGVGLAAPESAALVKTAVAAFAVNHAFAKSALFLGVSVVDSAPSIARRRLGLIGMSVAALAVIGAPLGPGAAAKLTLHHALEGAPRARLIDWVLSVGAVGSTLIMARVIALVTANKNAASSRNGAMAAWLVLLVLPWPMLVAPAFGELVRLPNLWAASWPIAAGLVLAAVLHRRELPAVPAGDLLTLAHLAAKRTLLAVTRAAPFAQRLSDALRSRRQRFAALCDGALVGAERAESHLAHFATVGLLGLILLIALLLAFAAP